MKSDKEQQQIDNIIQKNVHEINNFMICDKLLGAYIHCINAYSINHVDCEKISNILDNIKICNIRTK
jgi:hypothetical protein